MAADSSVPRSLLVSFLSHATGALEACNVSGEHLSLTECKQKILEVQTSSLEQVVEEYQETHPDEQYSVGQVQTALASLSTTNQQEQDSEIINMTEQLEEAARTALARLVLASECLRTNTTSLNEVGNRNTESEDTPPIREAILEFCAFCQAASRIPSVRLHIQDPNEALLECLEGHKEEDTTNSDQHRIPAIRRVENLQRLFLQAMGYNADEGLKEFAKTVKAGANEDSELVHAIQKTSALLLESSIADSSLLSDQQQGGVTRVVSVQHREKTIEVEGIENNRQDDHGAPVSQSMRGDENLQLAQQAVALRESLVNELLAMTEEDRKTMLEQAEQALEDFQKRAMELPPGPERILFLRNMDPTTQKLLAMHRIWQEHLQSTN